MLFYLFFISYFIVLICYWIFIKQIEERRKIMNNDEFSEIIKDGSSIIQYAENEFRICGWLNSDGTYCDKETEKMCTNIIEILKTIETQQNSEFSYGVMINVLTRLLNYKPLSHLSGNNNEWYKYSKNIYKNKRYDDVIKFVDDNGNVVNVCDMNTKRFVYSDGSFCVDKVSYTSNINIGFL